VVTAIDFQQAFATTTPINRETVMIVTREFVESIKSLNGGYSRAILTRLGVAWPPKHGWMKRVIGQEIDDFLFVKDPINPGRWKINTDVEKIPDGLMTQIAEEKRNRRREKRQERESVEYSYFIGALGTDCVKIGKTTRSVKYRLSALQTSCPHKLVVLATTPLKEKTLHHKFRRYRTKNGEWFKWSTEMQQFLNECGKNGNPRNIMLFCQSIPSDVPIEIAPSSIPPIDHRGMDVKFTSSQLDSLKLAFKKKFSSNVV
jgi:hypothetical protein